MRQRTCSDCSSASRATTRLLVPPAALFGVPGWLSAECAEVPWRSRLPGRPPERLTDSCDLSPCSWECCPASLPSPGSCRRAALTCQERLATQCILYGDCARQSRVHTT